MKKINKVEAKIGQIAKTLDVVAGHLPAKSFKQSTKGRACGVLWAVRGEAAKAKAKRKARSASSRRWPRMPTPATWRRATAATPTRASGGAEATPRRRARSEQDDGERSTRPCV